MGMKESYNEHAKSKVKTNDCPAVSFRRTAHARYRQLMGWANCMRSWSLRLVAHEESDTG